MSKKLKRTRRATGRQTGLAVSKPRVQPQRTLATSRQPGSSARQDSGLAPGMHAINTYLAVANIPASLDFLERTFGFSRGVVLPGTDGQPRYAEMHHGESVVMLVRKDDALGATGGAAALYTYVDDVDRVATRAREAGAGVGEVEDKPWGDRVTAVTDPDGYRWMLATFRKLVPFS